jgi:integrase
MKRSGLPLYVSWVFVNGKRYARARRHGKGHYFKNLPGTEEFAAEYQTWLVGNDERQGLGRNKAGSVSALIAKYYRSAEWVGLSESTQATYRGILERFRQDHGDKPVALLERKHVRAMLANKANTPSAANNLLSIVRILMRFAVEEEWRKDDPTLGIERLKIKSGGFHCWTDDELETFERHWPVGTMQRLSFALLLYSFQRRGDVVRLGRQHMVQGHLHIAQRKTKAKLIIPVHPDLQRIIDATPSGNLTFLVTSHGHPFTDAGFGNWFRDACTAAGLPNRCAAHGLRKAACRRGAEAGWTVHQIAAWSGHKTLKEVERYTKAADQRRLAESTMNIPVAKLGTGVAKREVSG